MKRAARELARNPSFARFSAHEGARELDFARVSDAAGLLSLAASAKRELLPVREVWIEDWSCAEQTSAI